MPSPLHNRRLFPPIRTVPAVHFTGSAAQFLNIADNPALSMGPGVRMTIVAWVAPDSPGTSAYPAGKYTGTLTTSEYTLIQLAQGTFRFQVSSGAATASQDSPYPVRPGWSFVVGIYDGATLDAQTNPWTPFPVAYATDMPDTTGNFRLGTRGDGAVAYTGAMAQVGVAKQALPMSDLIELWNNGRGKRFGELSAALAAKFVAYWDLDDPGGSGATWLDKAGANHLTAGLTTAAPVQVTMRR